jgi:hypothetical protein
MWDWKFLTWYFSRFASSGMWFCVIIWRVVPDISHAMWSFKMSGTKHPKTQHHIPKYLNFQDKISSTICLWKHRFSKRHSTLVSCIFIHFPRRLKKVFTVNATRMSNLTTAIQVHRSVGLMLLHNLQFQAVCVPGPEHHTVHTAAPVHSSAFTSKPNISGQNVWPVSSHKWNLQSAISLEHSTWHNLN